MTCPPSGKSDRSGRVYLYDSDVPGLALCFTETGARSFYLVKSSDGRTRRYRLGSADEMTIDQARNDAAHKMLQIRDGKDPMVEKRRRAAEAARTVATVGDLWEAFQSSHLAEMKPGTQDEYTRIYDLHIAPQWKNRRGWLDVTSEDCRGAKSPK